MAESNNPKLITEERVFLIKTFYKTDKKVKHVDNSKKNLVGRLKETNSESNLPL